MLTLGKVSDAASASAYYGEADDYYFRGHAPTEWLGAGAAGMGLKGEVDQEDFTRLLEGRMPDGTRLQMGADGSRRAATDFTFSSPKSVSLQAIVGGDVRLLEAHEVAVKRAMQYVEQELAGYRERRGDRIERFRSGNLVVATFRHELSRALDPQLHTHCLMMNATRTPDGRWRALDQTALYRQQKLVGALYRAELALEVQRLGYGVRVTHSDGRFELSHFTHAQVEAFSERSRMIEAALAAQGKTRADATAKFKEKLALDTREAKVDVDPAAVMATWKAKSREMGIDYAPRLQAREVEDGIRRAAAVDGMAFAVAHLTERQAIVEEHRLLAAALGKATGKSDLAAVREALGGMRGGGELLRSRDRYTTEEARASEREILGVEWRGREAVARMLQLTEVSRMLHASSLNEGQRAAVRLVATTTSRVAGVQGVAGAGKTTMLKEANRLVESAGYRLVGLAPSAAAAGELKRVGIASETIAAFLANERTLDARSVVVVDEAGMVATRDLREILARVEASGARAVLIGDTRQLKAIRAGKPFAQLQEAGMEAVAMNEVLRQREAVLREAVELAAGGDVRRSLARLKTSTTEIDTARERHAAIAREYAGLGPEARAATLIVAGTRGARALLNAQVRAELGLAGQGVTVAILEARDLTDAQAKLARSYQPGDVVRPEKTYPSLGFKRGDLARVVEIARNTVRLERADGVQVTWTPREQPNFTAYNVQARELAVGDRVRFTSHDYAREIMNGELGIVAAIDAERSRVTIEKASGDCVTLAADAPLHLDHGYASTVHSAQGLTCERVLIDADTGSVTANEAQYYVAISRATHEARLFTDDLALLPEAMARADVKEAALELTPEREVELER